MIPGMECLGWTWTLHSRVAEDKYLQRNPGINNLLDSLPLMALRHGLEK